MRENRMVMRVSCAGTVADVRGVPPSVHPRCGSADQPLSCSERGAFYGRALEVSGESGVVELAVVEQHVCVGVGGDRERALADAGADQRPGLALAVPKADAAVAQVVWATTWACRRLCRRVRWRCAAALG